MTILLNVFTNLKISNSEAGDWQADLEKAILQKKSLSLKKDLFELCAEINDAKPEIIVQAVTKAFLNLGLDKGSVEIALSEHDDDDEELETPPYFETTINRANPGKKAPTATIQIEVAVALEVEDFLDDEEDYLGDEGNPLKGKPFTPVELAALEKELRAKISGNI